ncbi:MAG: hypothetical protein PHW53_03045 [Patescibacteria group bacterium]|nr:hypothetical protein [Patescibacteria group bacterium]
MKKKKNKKCCCNSAWIGLTSAVGEIAYVALVVLFFWLADEMTFGNMEFIGVGLFLLVFVFSAIVSGSILIVYPAVLVLRGEVKRGLTILAWTAVFLFGFIALGMIGGILMV